VEGSQPAWRVFDSPGADGAQPAPAPGALASGVSADRRLAVVGGLGAAAIAAVAVALVLLGSGGERVEGPERGYGAFATGSPSVIGVEILVDVSGAVAEPGLYRLAPDARIADAIEAAGGYSPRVDVERVGAELNLAAALVDGQQVRIPSRDDVAASARPGGSGQAGAGVLVNLNAASQAELEELPGIGPVTAGKIMDARAEAPFRTIDELRERGLVGEKTFEQIRALVTVG
jgi:competence protein ComEA